MSLGEWLEEATPRRARVPVCFDGDLVSRLEEAKARSVKTELTPMLGDDQKIAASAEVEELTEAVKTKTRVFVIESLGWGQQREIIAQHPPQADQAEAFERLIELTILPRRAVDFSQLNTDEVTFAPAMLAAACAEPKMTVEEALELVRILPTGDMTRVWDAVLKLNNAGLDFPFVVGFIDSETPLASAKK